MDYITNKISTSTYDATAPQLDLCELWKQIISVPDVSSAQYISTDSAPNIQVNTSQRDQQVDSKRDSIIYYNYDKSTSLYTASPAIQSDHVMTLQSPSGNRQLIIRSNSKHSDEKNKLTAYWLDIYDRTGRLLTTTTTKDIHGKILTGTLGGMQWSSDEHSIVYTAECKSSKQYGLYEDSEESDHKIKGLQYEWKEEWGEQYAGVSLPRIYILSLEYPSTIYSVDGIPHNYTVAQPIWSPDNNGIIVTGWNHEPRKLGITHYNVRKSELYYIPFNLNDKINETRNKLISRKVSKSGSSITTDSGISESNALATNNKNEMILLTPNEHSAMCARVSPDNQSIVFVTTRDTLAHASSSYLKLIQWNTIAADISKRSVPTPNIRTVVDIVNKPVGDSFCGLYLAAGLLPSKIWLNNQYIAVATTWKSINVLVVIDSISGRIQRILPPGLSSNASVSLADVTNNHALIYVSTPTSPTCVYTGSFTLQNDVPAFEWTLVHNSVTILNSDIQQQVSALQYSIIQHHTTTLPEHPFESILLMPAKRSDNKLPGCVVFPHGGPHAAYTTSYMAMSAYFALCGLAVLHINYRGSTGYGEAFLESLPSRCGALDVIDCVDAANDVVKQKLVDADNLVVFGGSHGGFLGLHLIGQYPDMFKSCCVRNPVCNVNLMSGLSDIPDWCLYEAGVPYDSSRPPSIEHQTQMFAASPTAHVSKVNTPTYLMLGTADRRVPMAQALDYGRYLKSNHVKHRIAIYPDCQHSLDDKIDITFNMGVDCTLWLLQRFYTIDSTARSMDLSIPKH